MTETRGWQPTRLKDLFKSIRNGTWGDEPDGEDDVYCARGTDFDRVTARVSDVKMPRRKVPASALRVHQLRRGDLVLEKSGGSAGQPVGGVALFDLAVNTVCSNFNARMQVATSYDPRYVCYLMNSLHSSGFMRQFVNQTTGIQNLDAEVLLAQPCTVPPLDEQRRIADFLDAETEHLGVISRVIERRISLLEDRRRALLTSVFADSRSKSVRLGYYLDLVTSGPRGWGDFVGSKGVPFFRSANLRRNGIEPNLDSLALVEPPGSAAAEALRSRVRAGDVLVGITGANTAWVALADDRVSGANVSQHVCLARPGRAVDGEWLAFALSAPRVQELLLGSQYGGTKTQLSLADIRDLIIPIPAPNEQQEIAARVRNELAQISGEREIRARQLGLLSERRQALIAGAVTGQVDVSTARRVRGAT